MRREESRRQLVPPQLLRNSRGVIGWVDNRRLNLERYFYTFHRASGLAIVGYLFIHIYTTSTRLGGKRAWETLMEGLHHPLIYVGEFLLIAIVAFHGLNGVRLILAELGLSVGNPRRPIYPYRPVSLGRVQRYTLWILMIVAGVFIIATGLEYVLFLPLKGGK